MEMQNKSVNAGVHNSIGIEFQKHCALYFLFEKYEKLKDRKYFICLEHHDDFLFCYQTSDELVASVDSYQAKKSSTAWKLGDDMYELVKKMTDVGLALYSDSTLKANGYKHNLQFVTNNSIILSNGKRGKNAKAVTINESNSRIKFVGLDQEISNRIKDEIKKIPGVNLTGINELNNVSMIYIDLPKQSQGQKYCLEGEFRKIFGKKVIDCSAAINTLLLLFRNAENTLNQGNVVKLMDESKRVDYKSINNAINIITTKSMAFELWRNEKKEICKKLNIFIPDRNGFEISFSNSFDRFKDMLQVEHIKIFSFVKNNVNLICNSTDEVECIEKLYEKFQESTNSQLDELNIKAAIYAAYIETRETL